MPTWLQKPTNEHGVWKFVKVNGEYRWDGGFFCEHRNCVGEGETGEAAGTLGIIHDSHFRVCDWRSSTLGLSMGQKEIDEISELLGIPYEDM